MNVVNGKQNFDKRIKGRKPYSGHIFFAAKNGFNEGRLENYSPSGLFIKNKGDLIDRRNCYHRPAVLEGKAG